MMLLTHAQLVAAVRLGGSSMICVLMLQHSTRAASSQTLRKVTSGYTKEMIKMYMQRAKKERLTDVDNIGPPRRIQC